VLASAYEGACPAQPMTVDARVIARADLSTPLWVLWRRLLVSGGNMGECDTNERVGAAVLAAGYGERMRGSAHPKPLTTVAGLTLLERTVRTLRLGGVAGPIIVVVGHRQGGA